MINREQKDCVFFEGGFCTRGYFNKKPTVENCAECYKINGVMEREDFLPIGDVVEKIAQPIARVIDKVAGTDLQNCGGCKKRKDQLNQMVKKPNT